MNTTQGTTGSFVDQFSACGYAVVQFDSDLLHAAYAWAEQLFARNSLAEECGEIRAIRLVGYKESTFRQQVELRRDHEGQLQPKGLDDDCDVLMNVWEEAHRAVQKVLCDAAAGMGFADDDEYDVLTRHLERLDHRPKLGKLSNNSLRICKYISADAFLSDQGEGEGEESPSAICPAHTDVGYVTLILSSPVAGLEVLHPEDGWVSVSHNSVVLVADCLQALTGGHFRSAPHRVTQRGDGGRISISFHSYASNNDVLDSSTIPDAFSNAQNGQTRVSSVSLRKKRENARNLSN